jgi:hypothetical protein
MLPFLSFCAYIGPLAKKELNCTSPGNKTGLTGKRGRLFVQGLF